MNRVVLVVDDDCSVLETVRQMLEELGCEVVSARGGPEALDRLRRADRIEVLITDINMPQMDGNELAHLAKRIRPQLRVLQLSGRERRRGGYAMIRKPFSLEDLATKMEQTMGAR
jgi:CheY-like chemotaxis protein